MQAIVLMALAALWVDALQAIAFRHCLPFVGGGRITTSRRTAEAMTNRWMWFSHVTPSKRSRSRDAPLMSSPTVGDASAAKGRPIAVPGTLLRQVTACCAAGIGDGPGQPRDARPAPSGARAPRAVHPDHVHAVERVHGNAWLDGLILVGVNEPGRCSEEVVKGLRWVGRIPASRESGLRRGRERATATGAQVRGDQPRPKRGQQDDDGGSLC